MSELLANREFQIGVVTGIGAVLSLYAVLFFLRSILRPWIFAVAAGVKIELARLVGMRLRRTNPRIIIDAYVRDRKRGGQLSLDHIEATYIAFRNQVDRGADLLSIVDRETTHAQGPSSGAA